MVHRYPSTTLILMILALALVSEGGCGRASPRPARAALTPIVADYRPETTVSTCIDDSGTTDLQLVPAANKLLADMVDAAVQPASAPFTLYYTLLSGHPYDPNSTPLIIRIPGLPAQPAPPALTPLPTPSGDPYADALKRQQIQKANDTTLAAYQQVLAQEDAALERVRRQTRQQTDALRQLHVSLDLSGTAVDACLALAGDRLSTASGERFLWLTGDLQDDMHDAIPPRSLNLHGVHIRAVEMWCSSAQECRATKAYWSGVFQAAGAQDWAYFDPAQSTTLDASPFFSPQ